MAEKAKMSVWVWTVVGVIGGGWLGGFVVEGVRLIGLDVPAIIGLVIGGILGGVQSYKGSVRTGGKCPSWIWKPRQKQEPQP